MATSGALKVSARGQMSLPAPARHRWKLDNGGEVAFLDLGDAVIIVPGDIKRLRRELLDAVTPEDWDRARSGFGDPELASE